MTSFNSARDTCFSATGRKFPIAVGVLKILLSSTFFSSGYPSSRPCWMYSNLLFLCLFSSSPRGANGGRTQAWKRGLRKNASHLPSGVLWWSFGNTGSVDGGISPLCRAAVLALLCLARLFLLDRRSTFRRSPKSADNNRRTVNANIHTIRRNCSNEIEWEKTAVARFCLWQLSRRTR